MDRSPSLLCGLAYEKHIEHRKYRPWFAQELPWTCQYFPDNTEGRLCHGFCESEWLLRNFVSLPLQNSRSECRAPVSGARQMKRT